MTNPLEIYEVVQRVGCFIQTFKRREDHRHWHFDFHPRDLISCMMVSKMWHQALSPLLWRVYDEEEMIKLEVPPELYRVNSHYFWYLDIETPWPRDTLKPTQLRQLTIYGLALKASLGLLRTNRLLTRLDLKLWDDVDHSDIQEAFDGVTWLKTLWFHCGETLDPDHLAAVIFNNQELKELLVSNVRGFERVPSNQQPLMDLTSLRLDTRLDGNHGFVELIRFCPSLEDIWFHGYDTCPFEAIATNIRECCPKVSSIRCLDSFNLVFGGEVITEDEVIALIKSSRGLIQFEMPILDLTAKVSLALLNPHLVTLKLLRLYIYGHDALTTLSNAGRILTCCINLEKFVLRNELRNWQPLDCIELLRLPWNCKKLGAFTVGGIRYIAQEREKGDAVRDFVAPFQRDPGELVPMVLDADGNVIREANATELACETKFLSEAGDYLEYEFVKILGTHGWVMQELGGANDRQDLGSSYGNALVKHILYRTISLANIRKVTINQYLYCKASSPELRQGM